MAADTTTGPQAQGPFRISNLHRSRAGATRSRSPRAQLCIVLVRVSTALLRAHRSPCCHPHGPPPAQMGKHVPDQPSAFGLSSRRGRFCFGRSSARQRSAHEGAREAGWRRKASRPHCARIASRALATSLPTPPRALPRGAAQRRAHERAVNSSVRASCQLPWRLKGWRLGLADPAAPCALPCEPGRRHSEGSRG